MNQRAKPPPGRFGGLGLAALSIAALGLLLIGMARVPRLSRLAAGGAWRNFWQRPIPHQRVPEGLASLRAADCGVCHLAIYAEWRTSIHAMALADPQFQAEWKKDGVYVCVNCHAPLQNQQPLIVSALIDGDLRRPLTQPNPRFDPELRDEAITCAVCHVRNGVVYGPYGDSAAPHPVAKDPWYSANARCVRCHDVAVELDDVLLCVLDSGRSWRGSSAPRQGETCVTCHMPEVRRSNTWMKPIRNSNVHTWVGAGIPKFAGVPAPVPSTPTRGINVGVAIDRPRHAPGAILAATVTIANARAGHEIPTGDVERFLLVTLRIEDAQGGVLAEKTAQIGELWQWWPAARQLEDTSLAPGERRTYTLYWRVPEAGAPGARLRVVVTNNRMTLEHAAGMGLWDYPRGVTVYETVRPLVIVSPAD